MKNKYYISIENNIDEIPLKILKAQIRMIAHIIDKQMQLNDSDKRNISNKLYEKLKKRIEVYKERDGNNTPDIEWAKEITMLYELYKNRDYKYKYPWVNKVKININKDEFRKLIESRRSIRMFIDKEIPINEIKEIISFANWAPSNCNNQLTRYVIIRSKNIKEKININLPGKIGNCIIAVIGDYRFYDDINIEGIYHDSAAAIQNILLGCCIYDIGACYVADEGVNNDIIRKLLGINEYEKITALLWLGYYEKEPIVPARDIIDDRIEII